MSIKAQTNLTEAEAKVAGFKAQIHALTVKNWPIILDARTKEAEGKLATLHKTMDRIRKSSLPLNVKTALLDAAQKKVDALNLTLAKLNGLHVSVGVGLVDNATPKAHLIKASLGAIFGSPINQNVYIRTTKVGRKAAGGVVYGPQLSWIGEKGPEAVVPLNNPLRAAQVMAEAGLNGIVNRLHMPAPAVAFAGGAPVVPVTNVAVYLDSEPIAARVEVRQSQRDRVNARLR